MAAAMARSAAALQGPPRHSSARAKLSAMMQLTSLGFASLWVALGSAPWQRRR